jgi:hypothetical protein
MKKSGCAAAASSSLYVSIGRIIARGPQELHIVITTASDEFGFQ